MRRHESPSNQRRGGSCAKFHDTACPVLDRTCQHAAKRGRDARLQTVDQHPQFAASDIPAKFRNNPPCNFQIFENRCAGFVMDDSPVLLYTRCVNRFDSFGDIGVGFSQQRGAARKCERIDPVCHGKITAHCRAVETHVAIGWIDRAMKPPGFADFDQFRFAPAEQRAHDRYRRTGHGLRCAHTGQPGQAAAAVQTHHQRFRLIVGMMSSRNRTQFAFGRPFAERGVTGLARFGL